MKNKFFVVSIVLLLYPITAVVDYFFNKDAFCYQFYKDMPVFSIQGHTKHRNSIGSTTVYMNAIVFENEEGIKTNIQLTNKEKELAVKTVDSITVKSDKFYFINLLKFNGDYYILNDAYVFNKEENCYKRNYLYHLRKVLMRFVISGSLIVLLFIIKKQS